MPRLADVLGAIMADIAAARHVADLQTIRIAKQYREDPLLRGMTVPRIRLPEVVLDLPIVVEGCSGVQGSERPIASGGQASSPPVGSKAEDPAATAVTLGSDVLRRLKDSQSAGTTARSSAKVTAPVSPDVSELADGLRVPSLNVIVTAEAIKACGEPAAVSKLRLVIREEGLEWSHDDGDGERGEMRSRLLPE